MSVKEALKKLSQVTQGKSRLEFMSTSERTPVARACTLIGMASGFELSRRSFDAKTLEKVCGLSQLNYRSIELTSHWWQKDHGPLLGYHNEQPIALLIENNEYVAIFPKEEKKVKVSPSLAQEIDPHAFMLYPPLPEKIGTVKALFRAFFKQNQKEYWGLIFTGILATLALLFFPLSNKILFDQVIPQFNVPLLGQVLLGLIVASLSASIFLFTREFISLRLNAKIAHRLQMSLWDRLLKLPALFFRKMPKGDLIQRTMIFDTIRRTLGQNALMTFLDGLFGSIYFFIMLYFNWKLALFVGAALILFTLVSLGVTFLKIKWDRAYLESNAQINAFLISMIQGIEKLRVAAAETFFFSKWAEKYAENQTLSLKSRFINVLVMTLNKTASLLFILIIYAFVISDIYGESVTMSIGDYLAFVAAFGPLSQAALGFLNIGGTLVSLVPFWQRVNPLLTEEEEVKPTQKPPGPLKGKIEIKSLSFRYAANAPLVLNDINLDIEPNTFIGIAGPSGCGKSTLCRLLIGFETPQHGAILYDEMNLNDLIANELRLQMGLILQQRAIFAGTFYENIVCGNVCPMTAIEEAMAMSTLDRDMHRFPSGLHTLLSSGGTVLSAGERQKLFLTRIFLGKPPIIIIDEGLNSLQSSVQEEILQNLQKLEATRIFVTHQLRTLKHVDQICLLDEEKIRAQGTFEELKKTDSYFRTSLEKQSL